MMIGQQFADARGAGAGTSCSKQRQLEFVK